MNYEISALSARKAALTSEIDALRTSLYTAESQVCRQTVRAQLAHKTAAVYRIDSQILQKA